MHGSLKVTERSFQGAVLDELFCERWITRGLWKPRSPFVRLLFLRGH